MQRIEIYKDFDDYLSKLEPSNLDRHLSLMHLQRITEAFVILCRIIEDHTEV